MSRVTVALCASLASVLAGCSPLVDVAFYNATGQPITVTNDAAPAFHAFIQPGASAPVDVLIINRDRPNQFTITTQNEVWIYRHRLRLVGSVSRDLWERRPFDSLRLHVRVDSRGGIYLLSPSGTAVTQPSGFPIHPDQHKKT